MRIDQGLVVTLMMKRLDIENTTLFRDMHKKIRTSENVEISSLVKEKNINYHV